MSSSLLGLAQDVGFVRAMGAEVSAVADLSRTVMGGQGLPTAPPVDCLVLFDDSPSWPPAGSAGSEAGLERSVAVVASRGSTASASRSEFSVAVLESGSAKGGSVGAFVQVCSRAVEPLCVEPLVVVSPVSVGTQEGEASPSAWVQKKYKAIGQLLGVTYAGYEGEITALLQDIEARHVQRCSNVGRAPKPHPRGRFGSRELKRLVSTVNYDGKGSLLGRDLLVVL